MSYTQPQNQIANIFAPMSIGPATSPDSFPQQSLITSQPNIISHQCSVIAHQTSHSAQRQLQNLINPQQSSIISQQSLINSKFTCNQSETAKSSAPGKF